MLLKPSRYSGQNHLPFRGQHLTTTVGFLPICLKTPVQCTATPSVQTGTLHIELQHILAVATHLAATHM